MNRDTRLISMPARITGMMAAAFLALSSLAQCFHHATCHHAGGHFMAGSCSGAACGLHDGRDCGSFPGGGHGVPWSQFSACRDLDQRRHDTAACPVCQAFLNLLQGIRGQGPGLFACLETTVGGLAPPDTSAPSPSLPTTGFPRAPPAC